MGGSTSSENYVNEVLNDTLDILNQTTQDCSTSFSQDQQINLTNIHNCSFGEVDMTQASTIDTVCVQTAVTEDAVTDDITATTSQDAEATSTFYNMSQTDSNNVMTQSINLSNTITNLYTQTCMANLSQNQELNVGGCYDSPDTFPIVNMNQSMDYLANCVQSSASYATVATSITDTIDQYAKSVTKGGLGIFLLFLLLILVILIWGGLKTVTTLLNPLVFLSIGLLCILPFCIFYPMGTWPYSPIPNSIEVSDNGTPDDTSDDVTQAMVDDQNDKIDEVKKKNFDIFLGFLIPTLLVFIVIVIYGGIQLKQKKSPTSELSVPST